MDDLQQDLAQWQPTGRTTRWYEWLLILLLLGLANGVRAASVYKCTAADGAIAYQDRPCASEQQIREIELDPVPPPQPSPQYAIDPVPHSVTKPVARSSRRGADEPVSFECRTADGQVFYRHNACPHSIAEKPYASAGSTRRGGRSAGGSVSVSARRIGRDEACTQMHRAGRIGRTGHEHDEDVSTYDRNLGRDPCR